MTLVDRFIAFDRWPTSRKTALLCALGLPAQFLAWLACHLSLMHLPGLRLELMDACFAACSSALAFCGLCSLLAARAGQEGRWTAYLLVLVYGDTLLIAQYLYGTWNTPLAMFFPVSTILLALWYDARLGLFSFLSGGLALVTITVLELQGSIPYAPFRIDRAMDTANTLYWVLGVALPVMFFFGFCLGLGLLMISARKLQDERLQAAQELIRRYIPAQIADAMVRGDAKLTERHERRKLTIFFSDLVGFTEIAEELEPEDLSRVLNEYFSEMTAIAERHGGTVDELSGDAILVFFGAPVATDDRDHALRAVRMAADMQAATVQLNAKWRAVGIAESLQARMGINTGLVTIGNFGSPTRMKYAALGKHVNIAARLQAQCEPGKVLLSQTTWLLVQHHVRCEPRGELSLKGVHRPVAAYELLAVLPAPNAA